MRLEDITPLILTFDEAPNISRCLEQLKWAAEILIVDSGSHDGTLDIIAKYPQARVLQRGFDSFAAQCNFGLKEVRTPWVLSLDADYILNREFIEEISSLDGSASGYSAAFRYCVQGHPLRASLYPPRTVLYRPPLAHYENEGHGHRVAVNGDVRMLRGKIDHDDRKPFSRWVSAQIKYAELEAAHLLANPVTQLNRADRIRRWVVAAPALVFGYTLLGRGLILDGWPGWYYVLQRTLAELMLSLALVQRSLETKLCCSLKIRVHLVIPCYRESDRIREFLEELCGLSDGKGISILVVDDGSGAEEQERMRVLVNDYQKRHPHLRPAMLLPANIGKGGAVHAGWKAHQGEEWLGFVDADGACSAAETMRLIGLAQDSAGHERALFASRNHILGHRIERHWYRDVIGRAHSMVVSLLLGIHVHDSQCGLKLLPRQAYEKIVPLLKVEDFGFDIELLAALVDSGFPVEEVPIDWHEVSGGKLRLFRDALKMFADILQVRARRKSAPWLEQTRVPDGHQSSGLAQ